MSKLNFNLPSNRKFGFFLGILFILIGTLKWGSLSAYPLFGFAVLVLSVTVFRPNFLLPLNQMWMGLGLLMGMIVNPLVLGIVFFGLFCPMGLVMRLFRRDELRLTLTSRDSYWKTRNTLIEQKANFKLQF